MIDKNLFLVLSIRLFKLNTFKICISTIKRSSCKNLSIKIDFKNYHTTPSYLNYFVVFSGVCLGDSNAFCLLKLYTTNN